MKTMFRIAGSSLMLCLWLMPSSLLASAASPGTVVAWGMNNSGQTIVPTGLIDVTALAAGNIHTVALKSDGTVVAWGDNYDGQTNVPVGLNGVIAIGAGTGHTVVLKSDGTVAAWGYNYNGQVSIPTGLNGVTAIAAGGYHTVALKSDGTVVAWGDNSYGQTTIPAGLNGVVAVAAGGYHTVALKSDGTVVAWGQNFSGQTNVPPGLSGLTAIAAGFAHTVALKSDGTVVAWGAGTSGTGSLNRGQSIVPAGLSGVTAITAGSTHTVALKNNGTIVAWGNNTYGQTTVPAGLSGVTAIAAGSYHTVAVGVAPPSIIAQPQSLVVNVASNAVFSLSAIGTTPLSYQWKFDGSNIPGAITATYEITNVQPANAGTYFVVVTNVAGSLTSSNAALRINGQPVLSNLSLSASASILPSGNQSFVLAGGGLAGTNVLLEYANNPGTTNWTVLTFFTSPGFIEEAYDLFSNDQSRYYRLSAGAPVFTNLMLQGAVRYAGRYPPPANIPYFGADGASHTAVGAFPGWLELIADPTASVSSVTNSLHSAGTTIRTAIPAAGLYWVQVASGTEASVLSALFNQHVILDGSPAVPAVFGSADTQIDVLDWNDPSDRKDSCGRSHMNHVADIAGSRRQYDVYNPTDPLGPQMFDIHDRTPDLAADVLLRMHEAYTTKKRLTINLSLQSPASGEAISVDNSRCSNASCNDIRVAQNVFFKNILQMLEETNAKQPGVCDNTLVSIIAGNAGVDLDTQLANLKAQYPNAFARVVIVGGTDASGNIANEYNHLDDNMVPNMVYARAQNVEGCSGTSFAAPEVTSVLDAIWSRATNKTSAEILAAFRQAMGTNNIIPADAAGRVTTNFIDQAVTLVYPHFRLTLAESGTGTGTITALPPGPAYTNGAAIALSAIPDAASTFGGWSGDATGSTPLIQVIMNANKSIAATFNGTNSLAPSIAITSAVSTIVDQSSLYTDFSVTVKGMTTGTPSNYTYEAGWGSFGQINKTLTSTPETWSFTFTYTLFGTGASVAIPLWADEYDASQKLVGSAVTSITLRD